MKNEKKKRQPTPQTNPPGVALNIDSERETETLISIDRVCYVYCLTATCCEEQLNK